MQQAIVIGAGVIGAAVAFRLAQGGAAVTVLEAGRPGGGTSGCSFAWTNANNKPPRAYHDLNVAGMRAHAALAEEFGGAPWWHGGGSIEWVEEAEREEQRTRVERLRDWGYAAEWIERDRLMALEPGIDPRAVGGAPIAYYPEEGWLDPALYIDAMLLAARRHGARLVLDAPVVGMALQGGRVTGVRMRDGAVHAADIVVNCAGRWINEPMQEAGLHLPLDPSYGLLAFTPPVAGGVARVVHTPIVNVRPDGAGRLMLIHDATDATVNAATRPSAELPAARDLVERVQRLLPGIGAVLPEAARIAIRPVPRDHVSAVGTLPRLDGYYVAVTHSGVTLSPFLGIAIADEMLHGADRPELAAFRPARFFN